jgi:hypothetical protein
MGKLRGTLVAAVAVIGLALAGCGGSNGDSNAASPPGSGSNGAGSSGAEDRQTELLKYSQCMRENGVPDFPDPENGRLQLKVHKGPGGNGLDPDSPQFKAAEEKCKDLQPAGLAQQAQSGERQEQMLKYVDCMRKNGVPNFPDPQADGRLLINRKDLGMDPESPTFKAAEDKCRDLAPGGVAPGEQ